MLDLNKLFKKEENTVITCVFLKYDMSVLFLKNSAGETISFSLKYSFDKSFNINKLNQSLDNLYYAQKIQLTLNYKNKVVDFICLDTPDIIKFKGQLDFINYNSIGRSRLFGNIKILEDKNNELSSLNIPFGYEELKSHSSKKILSKLIQDHPCIVTYDKKAGKVLDISFDDQETTQKEKEEFNSIFGIKD